jgi:RNA polymerase sigma-70 factor (ECF subfamily)
MSDVPNSPAQPPRAASFATTQWSLVLLARERASPQADEALARLCRAYWYPLYAYIRRQVPTAEQAEDLTQEFFTRLLEKEFLRSVDRTRGRFRAFLLACCKHFLANERDRARAAKRGGGCSILSLDFQSAAERYRLEPADTLTPERLFERRWALTLLDQTLERLGQEYSRAGKGELFERLKATLVGAPGKVSHAAVAEAVGMTEVAVKKAAERLRKRYRAILRELIAATVEGPAEIDDEIQTLFAVLSQ